MVVSLVSTALIFVQALPFAHGMIPALCMLHRSLMIPGPCFIAFASKQLPYIIQEVEHIASPLFSCRAGALVHHIILKLSIYRCCRGHDQHALVPVFPAFSRMQRPTDWHQIHNVRISWLESADLWFAVVPPSAGF